MAPSAVFGVDVEQLGDRLARLRLPQPHLQSAMVASLHRYGQISPVVVFVRAGQYELIDGFKRREALREVGQSRLSARVLETDEKGAKVAMLALNGLGRRACELEEAWIVFDLVRGDKLAQIEVATLLGESPSWVCRRLALIERLGEEGREDLGLGLLSVSAARHLSRLPRGNQAPVLGLIRAERLTVRELGAVVDLLLAARDEVQRRFILEDPREALLAARTVPAVGRDPRLSGVGVQLWQRVGGLLAALGRLDEWLTSADRKGLTARDRQMLTPRLARLAGDASTAAIQCRELIGEWQRG
jgi:ParB-like chromosome segregation protein Spo0J